LQSKETNNWIALRVLRIVSITYLFGYLNAELVMKQDFSKHHSNNTDLNSTEAVAVTPSLGKHHIYD